MDITGKFKKASEIKTFESGYQVQEFYVDCSRYNSFTGELIENLLKFQVGGQKIDLLQDLNKGDLVKVHFNLKGKLYDKQDGSGKAHFQVAEVYKIEIIPQKEKETNPQTPAPPQKETPPPPPVQQQSPPAQSESYNPFDDEDDDLPF